MLLVDTAGRLAIDEALMQEIKTLHAALKPVETLFVVDAMQGQDAANTAKAFSQALPLTGIVLTKMDGDSRGGAALSVRQITGAPIKFAGTSEKIDGLEVFDAERHAGRILGMGDIVALVEQVAEGVDLAAARKLAEKMKKGSGFDLEDFLGQLQQMKQMGGLGSFMDKLPTQLAAKASEADLARPEKDIRRKEGIINSMTPEERRKPELLKASRKRRVAQGAGVHVQEVNRLLKEFEQMQGMMKQLKGSGLMKLMRRMGGMKGLGGLLGGGLLWLVAHRRTSEQTAVLGLLSALALTGVVTILIAARPTGVGGALRWLIGSVEARVAEHVPMIAIPVFAGFAALVLVADRLEILAVSDSHAHCLGVSPGFWRGVGIGIAVLLASAAVATVGPLAFVGFVAPHVVRLVFGGRLRRQVVLVAVCGGLFVAASDLIAKAVSLAIQLTGDGQQVGVPVGAVTCLIGAAALVAVASSHQESEP